MEGFSFVDIYATKGVEYLLTIGFLSGFLFFAVRFLFRAIRAPQGEGIRHEENVEWFRVPTELFFHRGHGWLRRENAETVRLGIDDFARKLVGAVDRVELPEIGASLAQGETGWALQADGKRIPMLSPVAGEVIAVNRRLLSDASLLAKDPFGEGWLLKVKPAKLPTDLKNLLTGDLARRWIEGAVEGLRMESSALAGATMQDGGAPVDGIARALYGEEWIAKVRERLLTGDTD